MFEGTFNRNIKLTLNLPYPTHRNILPVISHAKPLRITLAKRFLTFVGKLRSSEKPVLRHTVRLVENDTRTVTGRNLRNILLLTDRPDVQHLSPIDMDAVCLYGEPELWRVLAITDILEMRAGELQLPDGWSLDDMEVNLQSACWD